MHIVRKENMEVFFLNCITCEMSLVFFKDIHTPLFLLYRRLISAVKNQNFIRWSFFFSLCFGFTGRIKESNGSEFLVYT